MTIPCGFSSCGTQGQGSCSGNRQQIGRTRDQASALMVNALCFAMLARLNFFFGGPLAQNVIEETSIRLHEYTNHGIGALAVTSGGRALALAALGDTEEDYITHRLDRRSIDVVSD